MKNCNICNICIFIYIICLHIMEFFILDELNQNNHDHADPHASDEHASDAHAENVIMVICVFYDKPVKIRFPTHAKIGDIYNFISQKYYDCDFSNILYIIRDNDLSILGLTSELGFDQKLENVINNMDVLRVCMINDMLQTYENVKSIIPEKFAEWLFSDSEKFEQVSSMSLIIRELNKPSGDEARFIRLFLQEMTDILNEHFSHSEMPKHLTVEQFERFPSYSYQQLTLYKSRNPNHKLPDLTECPICCEDFVSESQLTVLPCKHYYHTHCCRKWLTEEKNTCPMCIHQIEGEEENIDLNIDDDKSEETESESTCKCESTGKCESESETD